MTSFDSVLVANRGEIAVRVMRTLRRLGIRSVAVYSDADQDAPHVALADLALHIGPTPAAESYLSIGALSDAIRRSGAQAVHPGYGFLSENADFARAVGAAGAVWVGPPPSAIEAMGDKVRAKALVAAAGVPVVPGSDGRGLSDTELAGAADAVGYPVLLKPSAGGGGKGMRVVTMPEELAQALTAARREAVAAFGDDTLLLERYVDRPRHIEVQVLADSHGGVIHLGERECSLQRRHQKILEEAPSALLGGEAREAIGASAVAAARSCGYQGAGTVEFIVSGAEPDKFYFMEMNTRLQVEHPVTELVTGLDLVEQQLRIAAGEPLPVAQDAVRLSGHAIEARVYAEDPARGFLPTGGEVLVLAEPAGEHVRVDSGIAVGTVVRSAYDPMLSKVIAWGADRDEALDRLDSALSRTALLGLGTNIGFLRALLADPAVRAGDLDTALVERFAAGSAWPPPPDEVYAAAALLAADAAGASGADGWDRTDGWRLGEQAWSTWRFQAGQHDPITVLTRPAGTAYDLRLDAQAPTTADIRHHGDDVELVTGAATTRFRTAQAAGVRWLGRDGDAWALRELAPYPRAERAGAAATGGTVRSPMPGTVLEVRTSVGERVRAGQALVVVEAMKMEHVVAAPVDGTVQTVSVAVGEQVALDAALASVTADAEPTDGAANGTESMLP